MSRHGEKALIQHMVDRDSLDTLISEGLPMECIPTEDLRKVVAFSVDYYFASGRTKAPSEAVILAEYGDALSDLEIELDDPDESVEWAIDDLKGGFAYRQTQTLLKEFAAAMAEAETRGRVGVLNEYATKFLKLGLDLEDRQAKVDVREVAADRLREYEARAQDPGEIRGVQFGLPVIDTYTRGVQPGELAILAAGPKVGKSFFMDRVALREWKAGKTVVLFTLENSVEMTLDRVAGLATGVSQMGFQHGSLQEPDVDTVRSWVIEAEGMDTALHVIQPSPGQRSVEALVRQAQILDADSLLIDQLSFIEVKEERQARYLQIREITHSLKSMISSGRQRIPCLLAHQISREGVKAADKTGRLDMVHLAEGGETERTADWVFGLYRSLADVGSEDATFQTLASRRERPRNFDLLWNIDAGIVDVRGERYMDTENR